MHDVARPLAATIAPGTDDRPHSSPSVHAERGVSPPRKRTRKSSPRREEGGALLSILEEMRKISHRVGLLERGDFRSPAPPSEGERPLAEVDTAPAGPPPAEMDGEEEDGFLDIHVDASSEDSLYSPRGPSPSVDDGEEGSFPRGKFEVALEAARDLGLSGAAAQAPPSPQDVWAAGSGEPSARPHFPVAQGFLETLRKSWPEESQAGRRGLKRGCAGMRGVSYAPESGLNWMPPVEREVAMLTSLPVGSVSNDPSHPTTGGRVSDRLLTSAFDAAMRTARAGNVLAILLAAAHRQLGGDSVQLSELLSTALSVQQHITADVGDCLAQLIRSRRHLWLSETSFPPMVRAQLVALPVEPGRVFHTSTRSVLEQAGEAVRAKEKIYSAFKKPVSLPAAAGARMGPRPGWSRGGAPRPPSRSAPSPQQSRRGATGRSFRGRGGSKKGAHPSRSKGDRPAPQQ